MHGSTGDDVPSSVDVLTAVRLQPERLPDLVAALLDKRLGAAALDVFEYEPRVPAALMDLPNVVLLPHLGSATEETRLAMEDLVFANLAAFSPTVAHNPCRCVMVGSIVDGRERPTNQYWSPANCPVARCANRDSGGGGPPTASPTAPTTAPSRTGSPPGSSNPYPARRTTDPLEYVPSTSRTSGTVYPPILSDVFRLRHLIDKVVVCRSHVSREDGTGQQRPAGAWATISGWRRI